MSATREQQTEQHERNILGGLKVRKNLTTQIQVSTNHNQSNYLHEIYYLLLIFINNKAFYINISY